MVYSKSIEMIDYSWKCLSNQLSIRDCVCWKSRCNLGFVEFATLRHSITTNKKAKVSNVLSRPTTFSFYIYQVFIKSAQSEDKAKKLKEITSI